MKCTHGARLQLFRQPTVCTTLNCAIRARRCDLAELKGGDAEYNAEVMRELLRGKSTQAISDVVSLNAGAGLYVYGIAETIGEGVSLAQKMLQSGEAIDKLDSWVHVASECERIQS